jgi:hypothetical protein
LKKVSVNHPANATGILKGQRDSRRDGKFFTKEFPMLHSMIDKEFRRDKVVLQQDEHPEMEATLAFALIERWGIVSAMPDGEDAAGRQKHRLMTPEELVERAFDSARIAVVKARELNLIHKCPILQPSVKEPADEAA